MSLAALEQALLDLAATALNDCGLVVPETRYRYHGDRGPVPCCDGGGMLTAHWLTPRFDRTGIPAGMGNPPGRPLIDLYLRLYRCFPMLDANGVLDGDPDAASAGLTEDLECIFTALTAAVCDGTLAAHLSGCDQLMLIGASPRVPQGGCAGIEWHLQAGWRAWGC